MKKKNILMTAVVVLLAACTSDDEARFGKSMPIRLAVAVEESAQTRAGSNVQNTELLSGEAVDVYIKNASTSAWIANPLACTVSGTSGDLTSASTLYYPYDGSSVSMYAVHPSVASGATFTVSADQTSDANYAQSDLTFSKAATYTYSTAVQTLPMTHLMAKVIVNISLPTATPAWTLTNLKLHAKRSAVVTYPVDNSDGYTLSAASDDGEISISEGGAVLIPPQTVTSGSAFVSFDIPGVGPYVYRLPADRTFEPGKQYVYTITAMSGTLTYAETSISQTYNTTPFTNPLTNTGSGQVVYTSSNTNVATVHSTTGEVTPVSVGSTTITAQIVDGLNNYYTTKTASYTFTMTKAAPTYTAPTAKSLTYNGSAQVLINAGSVTGGTMYYSLDNSNWYTSVDNSNMKKTDANTSGYTVYYKVFGDANHSDIASQNLKVTISKYTPTWGSWSNSTASVGVGSTFTRTIPLYGVNNTALTVSYSSNATGKATVNSSGVVTGVTIGSATITASYTATTNYNAPSSQSYTVSVTDPGVAFNSVTSSHLKYFIARNGKAYKTAAIAKTCSGYDAVGVICYAGAVSNYFNKFIAIALQDVAACTFPNVTSGVNTFANNRPVTVGSTTYKTCTIKYYDRVTNQSSYKTRTSGVVQGWRNPSMTDWRYIIHGLTNGNPSATNPSTFVSGLVLVNPTNMLNYINTACGNTNLQAQYYWTSTELSTAIDNGAVVFGFTHGEFGYDVGTNPKLVRPVFAW
ncbi:fimbrillin family protein [Prevotella sp. FD3004]|uniref:fimbrillin family protein n=1 Tax=Prevotella sp. FD3004 TaxID=1408309 RepID=UPI0018CF8CF5|nr:fimbrillin family protein [Prevotella sp. FD3004]